MPAMGGLAIGPEETMPEIGAFTVSGLGRSAVDSGIPSTTCESDGCISELDLETRSLNNGKHSCDEEEMSDQPSSDTWPFDHVFSALNYHPQYYEHFFDTHQYLMRGIGPLPFDQRCYIGILAASRHNCSYLVNCLASSFLACGGDEKWLAGLDHIPKKLRNLCHVNQILAHRPWLLTKQHIEKLTRGEENNWSISELTQALVLLAHFHSLSSFVFACGITLEGEHKRGHTFSSSSSDHGSMDSSSSESDVEIDLILERMKLLNEVTSNEITHEELRKRFDKIESQTTKLKTKKKPSKNGDLLHFVEDPEFMFEDFASRDPGLKIPTYVVQDYSWDDHGYSLMSRLYTEVAGMLDDKFQVTQGMTYYKMGYKQNVDTSTFRRAIWNYIHCLFGMYHDDYDYGEIDHLLEKNLKWYIKAATCLPEHIAHRNYRSFMKEFFHSEKVHINVMVLEARLQAELLYSLRAISCHMT